MENQEARGRLLGQRVTRREAIKAGGIAALGLAFSKPIIETIYPKPIFATTGTGMRCSGSTSTDNLELQIEARTGRQAADEFKAIVRQQLDNQLICAGDCPPGRQCFSLDVFDETICAPAGVNLFTCTSPSIERRCECSD